MDMHYLTHGQKNNIRQQSTYKVKQFPCCPTVNMRLNPPAVVFLPLFACFVRLDYRRYAAPRLARCGHYKDSCHDKSWVNENLVLCFVLHLPGQHVIVFFPRELCNQRRPSCILGLKPLAVRHIQTPMKDDRILEYLFYPFDISNMPSFTLRFAVFYLAKQHLLRCDLYPFAKPDFLAYF